ncbi:MAG: porin [Janthinobacterium lividum]
MNKQMAMAVLSIIGIASPAAHAQSSVTLYGVADDGLLYVKNDAGKSLMSLSSGNMSGSRFGLKGSEDLGGGLSAIFTIEAGFDINTGASSSTTTMYDRQVFVGLASTRYGTLTLGRQYDPLTDLVQPVQGDNFLGGSFTTPGDVDNANDNTRFSNAVKWTSPNSNGLQMSAMYSFGNVSGATGSGQTYSAAISYQRLPVTLAAGYMHIDNGNAAYSTRETSSADSSSLFGSSVNSYYETARSINIARVGGNYQIGAFTLGGYYSFSDYLPDASSTFSGSEIYQNGSLYGVWQMTPTLQAEIGYDYMKSSGNSSAHYNQGAVAIDYSLSKRTDVYMALAYQRASGQQGGGAPAQAVIGSWDIDSDSSSQGLAVVGLRHRF